MGACCSQKEMNIFPGAGAQDYYDDLEVLPNEVCEMSLKPQTPPNIGQTALDGHPKPQTPPNIGQTALDGHPKPQTPSNVGQTAWNEHPKPQTPSNVGQTAWDEYVKQSAALKSSNEAVNVPFPISSCS